MFLLIVWHICTLKLQNYFSFVMSINIMWQASITAVCCNEYAYSMVRDLSTDLSTLRTTKCRASHQHPLHLNCVQNKNMDKFKYLEPITQMLPPA